MLKKIYIIAAEASADLHGSNLVKAMNQLNPDIKWKGWGGPKLLSEGIDIDIRYEKANFMGFVEVIKNLPRIFSYFKKTKKSILEFKPDLLLLIDYPGFNLRMAEWAKKNNIPVYYFIAPQVWAWKESRVYKIKVTVRKLFVILPFEKEYFSSFGINAYYFGHPLMKFIDEYQVDHNFRANNQLSNKSIIALLPGSRTQEIKNILPVFLRALEGECKHQIVIAGLTQHEDLYKEICAECKVKATVVYNCTYDLLSHSRMALVTSGTATLETALFKVPQVVCYKGNKISYQIAKFLIKIKYISLVNLIMDRKIVSELIQDEFNETNIRKELSKLCLRGLRGFRVHPAPELLAPDSRSEMIASYKELHSKLFQSNTSELIAKEILADFS